MTLQEAKEASCVIEETIKRSTNSKGAFRLSTISLGLGILTSIIVSVGTLYTTIESAKTNAEVVRKAQLEKTKADVADAVELDKRQRLFDDTVKAVAALQKAVDTHTTSLTQLTTLVEASQKMQNEDHKALMVFFKRKVDPEEEKK